MITNYTELKTAIEGWLDRSDLTSYLADFIALAETKIKRGLRREATFTALSVGSPTSQVLTEAPDLYLFGSLMEAAPFLEHDERIATWKVKFEEALASYNDYLRRTATPSALNTQAGLEEAVDNWLGTASLTSRIPQFVELAIAQIARELRVSVTRAAITINAQTLAVPAGVAEVRFLSLVDGSGRVRFLDPVTPVMLADFERMYTTAGCPTHYRIFDGQIRFNRLPDTTYTGEILSFDQPSLVVDIAANPDLYLYATLLQAAPWLGPDDRLPIWEARYMRALSQANAQRQQAETGMQLTEMRLPVVFG